MGIRPGDPIAPWSPFTVLANDRYAAKAWDDRVGLGVMLEAMKRIQQRGVQLPSTIYLVATVQEEIGLRGAATSVRLVNPDLGISIEAGLSADYPGARPEQAQERLGGGPGIFLLDSSMLPNTKLRDFFFEVAAAEGITLQADVLTGYGQDGAEIQKFDTGRPVVNMTVPTRYLHSHTGIIDRRDFEGAVELLVAVLDAARCGDDRRAVEFSARRPVTPADLVLFRVWASRSVARPFRSGWGNRAQEHASHYANRSRPAGSCSAADCSLRWSVPLGHRAAHATGWHHPPGGDRRWRHVASHLLHGVDE
jgi:hypothetical protein